MGSVRSWLGAILSLVTFLVVRRFTHGFTVPTFVVIVFACVYVWTFVLRVPELRKDMTPAVKATASKAQEPTTTARVQEPAAAPKEAPAPTARSKDPQIPQKTVAERAPAKEDPVAAPKIASVPKGAPASETTPAPEHPVVAPSVEAEANQEQGTSVEQPSEATFVEEDTLRQLEQAREVIAAAKSDSLKPPGDAAGRVGGDPRDRFWKDQNEASDDESSDEEARLRREEETNLMDPEKAQALRLQGNDFFKAGQLHDAREAYSEALFMTPKTDAKDRAVLLCNRAACYQKLSRWDDVVSDCRQAIELEPEYVKAYCRRSAAYEAQSKWHDAHEDLKKAVEYDSSLKSKEYKHMAFLEKRAQETFEKDKDEMMGKLKDLGNTVLGKFGMSVDNFKMEQDPVTGSYSVKYGT